MSPSSGAVRSVSVRHFFRTGHLHKNKSLEPEAPSLIPRPERVGVDSIRPSSHFNIPIHISPINHDFVEAVTRMNIDRVNTLLSDRDIDSDVFERLLEGGANFDVRDGKGSTPLHILCYRGKLNLIEMLLEKSTNGVSLDTKNDAGRTALANAVFNNRTDVVRVLLQHGADPSIPDKNGITPLSIASVDEHSEITKMLLQHTPQALPTKPAVLPEEVGLGLPFQAKVVGKLERLQKSGVPALSDSGPSDYAAEAPKAPKNGKERERRAAPSIADSHDSDTERYVQSDAKEYPGRAFYQRHHRVGPPTSHWLEEEEYAPPDHQYPGRPYYWRHNADGSITSQWSDAQAYPPPTRDDNPALTSGSTYAQPIPSEHAAEEAPMPSGMSEKARGKQRETEAGPSGSAPVRSGERSQRTSQDPGRPHPDMEADRDRFEEIYRGIAASSQPGRTYAPPRAALAKAIFDIGYNLQERNQPEEAITPYSQVVGWYGRENDSTTLKFVTKACINMRLLHHQLGHPSEDIESCDRLVTHFTEAQKAAEAAKLAELGRQLEKISDSPRGEHSQRPEIAELEDLAEAEIARLRNQVATQTYGKHEVTEEEKANAVRLFDRASQYLQTGGLEENPALIFKCWTVSAARGHVGAKAGLGLLYKIGYGVEKDLTTAAKYYAEAAEGGMPEANYQLGLLYEGVEGDEGVKKNLVTAAECYTKAAESEEGHANAAWKLGLAYGIGEGVKKNPATAVKWFTKAAESEKGHAGAECALGFAYENGQEVEKNLVTAAEWYAKAAEKGDAFARGSLDRLRDKLDGYGQ